MKKRLITLLLALVLVVSLLPVMALAGRRRHDGAHARCFQVEDGDRAGR